jgi:hypothetical protein
MDKKRQQPRRATRKSDVTPITQRPRRSGNIAEFFASSPLRGSGIDLTRRRDLGRLIAGTAVPTLNPWV